MSTRTDIPDKAVEALAEPVAWRYLDVVTRQVGVSTELHQHRVGSNLWEITPLYARPVPQEALPLDRDTLGRMVREAWVRWAMTQPSPKPSWLLPYDELAEPDKEADRQIGEAIAKWTVIHYEARAALAPVPQEAPAEPVGLCSDCPPVGYPDRTRCLPCPRCPVPAAEPAPPARQEALRDALASHIATVIDDIEVTKDGFCKWSDVANARDAIYRTVRSAALAQSAPVKGGE